MKKTILALLFSLLFLFAYGQETKHFITDTDYRSQVQQQFQARQKLLQNRKKALLSIFEKSLSTQQKEALEFLYAYMPLSDLADYDGDFFLKQVTTALQAKNTFSWGKKIPEAIFRHFVLPFRINNEDLDTARVVFFNQLKDRVKNLSMYNTALEVNHWCHEKVNYKGSDIRTSAPLATMRTSWGRCGEESTFTVAAMRAVGIPARQVYTPRWAHTDDNHAWVEVFVDGKWYYLGACEPEPTLNKGWFDKPVKRAMLVHTRVFGKYQDTTNNLIENPLFTKINTLKNYTKTKTLTVKIMDTHANAVADAEVRFGIYNYAEFYPMVTLQSAKNGCVTITTGLGDLLISASKNDTYGEAKAIGTSSDTVFLRLKKMSFATKVDTLNIAPPIELMVKEVSNSEKQQNDQRLANEDSIRNAYKATFMQANEAKQWAISLQLDTAKVVDFIHKSQGNWQEIAKYFQKNATDSRIFDLLEVISEKDLRDTPEAMLTAHLQATATNSSYPSKIYNEGILNPRLQNERLRSWKPFLQKQFSEKFAANAQKNMQIIVDWILQNITINDDENYTRCPISPIGTYQLKTTDKQGRNLFFVALCRSFNIPARINQATRQPQYYTNGQWTNISFQNTQNVANATARLTLQNDTANFIKPEYYTHFTLQYFKDGKFETLDYQSHKMFDQYPVTLQLIPGYYCLMSGHRDDVGNIRILRKFFSLKKQQKIHKTNTLLPLESIQKIFGNLDTTLHFQDMQQKKHTLTSLLREKGAVFAILDPSKEPTRHIMVDIPLLKKEFDAQKVPFVFIIPQDKLTTNFSTKNYKRLPQNSLFVIDAKNKFTRKILNSANLSKDSFYPIVIFANKKGEISFLSTGYRIGIGESLLKQMQ